MSQQIDKLASEIADGVINKLRRERGTAFVEEFVRSLIYERVSVVLTGHSLRALGIINTLVHQTTFVPADGGLQLYVPLALAHEMRELAGWRSGGGNGDNNR
jgi:hypothetical protein